MRRVLAERAARSSPSAASAAISSWRGLISRIGLAAASQPAGAGQQLLELPVQAGLRRDQADRALGQPLGGAHVGDRVAERRSSRTR